MPTTIYPSDISIGGTYTGNRVLDYRVKVYPNGTSSQFEVEIVDYNSAVQIELTGGSTAVTVRTNNGDGTYQNNTEGVPIWVGDKIGEISGQTSVASNVSGHIGTIASITAGTGLVYDESVPPVAVYGDNVTAFALDTATYLDHISGTDEVDILADYQHQPITSAGSASSHQNKDNQFTHAYMYGLTFFFTSNFSGLLAPASPDTYLYFAFTAYPQKIFNADTMARLSKDGKTDIVGWSQFSEGFSVLPDIYDENTNAGTVIVEAESIQSTIVPTKPSLVTRGDDTYIGRGPDVPPLYIGYPNIKQFGKKMGEELVVTDGDLSLSTSVLPALEQFALPSTSTGNSLDLNVDLTAASQLIVGYIKGSSYLIKGRRDTGIESSYYLGGVIKAIYLDHLVNDEVWVLYDATAFYQLVCLDIGASGTAMEIKSNRLYSLESANDEQGFINPFMKTGVVPSDMVYLDGFIYISATDADYDDPNKSSKDKCFGIGSDRQHFIWKSPNITTAPSSIPVSGSTLIGMTSITPLPTTQSTTPAGGDTYWYKWKEEEEWWSSDDPPNYYGGGSHNVTNYGYFGGAGDKYKVRQVPAKRGLCVYSNEAGGESVALLINYVHNSFSKSDHRHAWGLDEGGGDGQGSDGFRNEWYRVGPFVKQDGKSVALGAHLLVWDDSSTSSVGINNIETKVKRVMVGTDTLTLTDTASISQNGDSGGFTLTWYGEGENFSDSDSLASVINTVSLKQPRAIALTGGAKVYWWNLITTPEADLNADVVDGHYYLNMRTSPAPKQFTPSDSRALLASQTFSYNLTGTKFSWTAVTFPNAFVCKFLDDVGNKATGASWESWDLLSSIKVAVSDPGGSIKDLKNLTPSAEKDDTSGEYEDADYYKNFYKVSLMFDGYQESCLGETVYTSSPNPNENGHKITIEVLASMLAPRISHVNIYRAKAWDGGATTPDLDYNLIESVSLEGAGWESSTSGYVKYEIMDNKGTNYGSYEALTGLSPAMTVNWVGYSESEECAGYLFTANAGNEEMTNVGNYVFRSKAGKFSMFNWANEYVALPDKPTALKAYKNLLFVFTDSKVYAINPNNLAIVDVIDGMGCLDPDSVLATDFGMFFADKHGVYQHDGRKGAIISSPIFTTDNTSLSNFTWDSISESLITSPPKLGFDGQRKALFVVFDVSGNSYAWVYSVGTKRWDLWSFTSPIKSLTQGKFGEVLASDGKLAQIGTSSTRKPWEFISKKITAGFDTYEKSFSEIHVEGDSGLTTTYKTSGVSSYQSLTSNRIASAYKKAKWLQLRVVDGAGTNQMESIGVHLRPLRAKSSKV